MKIATRNLAPGDFDWLRNLACAVDANCGPPSIPGEIAETLCDFGLALPDASGTVAITDRGREALLEQDMRDAEER